MASIMDLLTSQLSGGNLKQIGAQLGADEETTSNATGAAIGALLTALARNAAKPEGAEALSTALAKDHDGSVLANLQNQIRNPTAGPGDGILRHVLGGRRSNIEAGLSNATGLDREKTARLLMMLAPIVMGALGKKKKASGLDAGTLAGYLGAERQAMETKEPGAAGMLGGLLDADGDGDFDINDITKHGGGLLGKFLGKR